MAQARHYELEELVHRPGTYVNPATEIVIVVDDGAHVDAALLGEEEGWLLVSDEPAVDDHRRDEQLERFQRRTHRAAAPDTFSSDEDLSDVDDLDDELDAAGYGARDAEDED
jgi:hypothetical protein